MSKFSWDDIVQHYTPNVRAYVSSRTNVPHLRAYADDICQEVMLRLNRMLQDGQLADDIDALNGIVISVCKSKIRHQIAELDRKSKIGATAESDDISRSGLAITDKEQDLDQPLSSREIILQMAGKLPSKYREVIEHRLDDKTLQSTAESLGITKNAVAKREKIAIQMMRKMSAAVL